MWVAALLAVLSPLVFPAEVAFGVQGDQDMQELQRREKMVAQVAAQVATFAGYDRVYQSNAPDQAIVWLTKPNERDAQKVVFVLADLQHEEPVRDIKIVKSKHSVRQLLAWKRALVEDGLKNGIWVGSSYSHLAIYVDEGEDSSPIVRRAERLSIPKGVYSFVMLSNVVGSVRPGNQSPSSTPAPKPANGWVVGVGLAALAAAVGVIYTARRRSNATKT